MHGVYIVSLYCTSTLYTFSYSVPVHGMYIVSLYCTGTLYTFSYSVPVHGMYTVSLYYTGTLYTLSYTVSNINQIRLRRSPAVQSASVDGELEVSVVDAVRGVGTRRQWRSAAGIRFIKSGAAGE